jgi:Amiloride-sensitive sodium channel
MLHTTGDSPVCGPKNAYKCAYSALQNYTINNLASRCNCPRQCQQLTYSYSISQAEFSDHAIEWAQSDLWLANISADKIRHNYATLNVSIKFC